MSKPVCSQAVTCGHSNDRRISSWQARWQAVPQKSPFLSLLCRIWKKICFSSFSSRQMHFSALHFSYPFPFPAYHSISSTGVGCSFTTISLTLLLFMCITLSAMGHIAVLCVTSITVILSLRQVSCKSFSIILPVL